MQTLQEALQNSINEAIDTVYLVSYAPGTAISDDGEPVGKNVKNTIYKTTFPELSKLTGRTIENDIISAWIEDVWDRKEKISLSVTKKLKTLKKVATDSDEYDSSVSTWKGNNALLFLEVN